MAGRGPAPKDPALRRRRNEPARGEWVDLAPLERPVLPELPEGEWPPETVAAWDAWRSDPVTAQYSEADISYALDAIRLHAGLPGSAAEVRRRMDALGLTPKGKRDLRWRVRDDGDVVKLEAPSRGGSRRGRLAAVDLPG